MSRNWGKKASKKNVNKDDPTFRILLDGRHTEQELIEMIREGLGQLNAPEGQIYTCSRLLVSLERNENGVNHQGMQTICVSSPYSCAADNFDM